MSFNVSKTIPRPAKALHTSLSAGDSSSRVLALSSLGCSVQYKGKPSKDAQVPAENLETPYECPAVGMELGGGCVNFSKEFPLKGCEWEVHPNAFKHHLVHEEEGTPLSRCVIHTQVPPVGQDERRCARRECGRRH